MNRPVFLSLHEGEPTVKAINRRQTKQFQQRRVICFGLCVTVCACVCVRIRRRFVNVIVLAVVVVVVVVVVAAMRVNGK